MGSSLKRASVLSEGMLEGLLSKFSGQAIDKCDVRLFAFADCLQRSWVTGRFWGDTTAMVRPGVFGGNYQKIERGIDRE